MKSCGKLSNRVEHYFAGRTTTLCLLSFTFLRVALKIRVFPSNFVLLSFILTDHQTDWDSPVDDQSMRRVGNQSRRSNKNMNCTSMNDFHFHTHAKIRLRWSNSINLFAYKSLSLSLSFLFCKGVLACNLPTMILVLANVFKWKFTQLARFSLNLFLWRDISFSAKRVLIPLFGSHSFLGL